MGRKDAALLAADGLGVLAARPDQTTPHTPPACQPSGTYIQVPSHGIAFCPFERQPVQSLSNMSVFAAVCVCPYRVLGPLPSILMRCDAMAPTNVRKLCRIALKPHVAAALGQQIWTCRHCAVWEQLLCLAPVRSVQFLNIAQKKWVLHSSTAPHADDADAGTIAARLRRVACGWGRECAFEIWSAPLFVSRAFWPYDTECYAETHSGPGPFLQDIAIINVASPRSR